MIPSLAAGQSTSLARFDDVRSLQGGECFAPKSAPADSLSLTRIRNGKAQRNWPRDSMIALNDRIVVAPRADARVRVDGTLGRGNFYLVPQLGRCPGSELGRHLAFRNSPVATGSYEFKKDTLGRGAGAQERVTLVVKNGAAVVQWNSGQLVVRALDEQIRDLGSTFTVIVDSAANRGFITVQEGLITLRSGTRASAGQSYTFGPGQPLQQVIVRTAGLDEIRYHSDDVWQPPRAFAAIPRPRVPVPHLPWKYIIGGTLGATAAGYATWKLWPEKAPPPPPPVRAIVVITIPL